MTGNRRENIQAFFYVVFIILTAASTLYADIYMYIDSEGVFHFSNMPTSTGYEVYLREMPETFRRLKATGRYDDVIAEASKKHGVDFSLLKALIKVESDFNPRAVSRKGAMGLMQIMPGNLNQFNIKDPFNPKENIMGGTWYFKKLLQRFDGKLPLALAAYNAGPSAVDRYRNIPPFSETKNYVKKVMKYYNLLKK